MSEWLKRVCLPGSMIAGLLLAGIGLAVSATPAASEEPPHGAASADAMDCSRCHTCPEPTAEDLCLPPCTRHEAAVEALTSKHGPVGPDGFIYLDMIKTEEEGTDRFGPVPFDHAGHAKWAEIAGGCTICHHYTPEGTEHPACRSCHSAELKRPDLTKPSLKGAYHRQCMGCHREWSHNTKCYACHAKRANEADRGLMNPSEALGHMAKPIPEPDSEIYEPTSKPAPGTKIIFRHKEHVHRFGLKCADCHRGDNCARCHAEGSKHVQKERTFAEHHKDCADCHAVDLNQGGNCKRCHWKEGEPEPPPFDHVNTGWALNRYHKDNACRACHKTARFAKLDRTCTACHSDWEPDSFDHAVTGQVLDENHAEIDCEDCHADRRFDVAPKCDECHDEDEGFVFPNKRPGPPAKPSDG